MRTHYTRTLKHLVKTATDQEINELKERLFNTQTDVLNTDKEIQQLKKEAHQWKIKHDLLNTYSDMLEEQVEAAKTKEEQFILWLEDLSKTATPVWKDAYKNVLSEYKKVFVEKTKP